MNEYLAYGYHAELATVIHAFAWSDRAVMWLEPAIDHFLSADEKEHGLRFENYKSETPFAQWVRGRIFDAAAELKWEKEGQQFHVVYCGSTAPPAGLIAEPNEIFSLSDHSYHLWGSRIKDEDRLDLGLKTDEAVFAELRIPRILRYPVSPHAERVKLKVREFYNADHTLVYTRFLGLEEER